MLSAMLTRPTDPRLRSLAFQAFMAFTEQFDTAVSRELSKAWQEADRERARQMAAAQAAKEAVSEPEPPPLPVNPSQPPGASCYESYLVPLLATQDCSQHQESVQDLLPLVQSYQDRSPALLDLRLKLWEEGNDEEVATIAQCLRTALGLMHQPWWGVRQVGLTALVAALITLHQERRLPRKVYVATAIGLGLILTLVFIIVAVIIIRGLAS